MHPISASLLLASLAVYIGAGLGALLSWRRQAAANFVGFTGAACASCLSGTAAWLQLREPDPGVVSLAPGPLPLIQLDIHIDPLSALFLLIVSLLGLALSIYSVGYGRAFSARKNAGVLAAFYNAALLATTVVFVAADAWLFLIAWEIMALSAFCLVSFEDQETETRKAGVLYFVMSHIDAGCIILGFLLLFQASGDFSFASLHGVGARLSPGARDAAFLCFLLGFGIKAGIVPLHIWLPAAHPVAPSNVSAFMSGVMIKTGIYGLARVLFDFMGEPPLWWGVTVLVIGAVSALVGVLYALMEHDLKRLLAYHSIENIGIILMGLGAALMFQRSGYPLLASLALLAGLFHTINHASFKGLLFLAAGAVLQATHTRNMEELGGLAKRMPQTALFFLIGSIAISALPPLNGFVSEWLAYQALLQGFGTTESLIRLIFPLSGAMLALTGALAAACFVKAFGITFLAQPRSAHASHAHEVPLSMRAGMAILVLACFGLGLWPNGFIRLVDPVLQQLSGNVLSTRLALSDGWVLASLGEHPGTVSTLGLVLMGICLLPIPLVLWLVFGRAAGTRRGPTWDCGQRGLTPQMEYTATGFSKPIRMIFKALFRPHRDVQREYDFSPYFATTIRFESHVEELFETRIYRPARGGILRLSRRIRALQQGSIHFYLLYIFITLVLLLLFAL